MFREIEFKCLIVCVSPFINHLIATVLRSCDLLFRHYALYFLVYLSNQLSLFIILYLPLCVSSAFNTVFFYEFIIISELNTITISGNSTQVSAIFSWY